MGKSLLPEGFGISEDMRVWAESKVPQVNIEAEHEKFCDYWLAHGKKMHDWPATWRNWMRRAPQMKGALYSADEMHIRALMREYVPQGFRRAFVHETALMYEQAYRKHQQEKLPQRDMRGVLQLVQAKRA